MVAVPRDVGRDGVDRPDLGYGFTAFDGGEVAREGDVAPGEMMTGTVSAYIVVTVPAATGYSITVQ